MGAESVRAESERAKITILVGTMTGTAEMVAQEVEQVLRDEGHDVALCMMNDAGPEVFETGRAFLICTSTYGFGNLPDNALDLFEGLEAARPDLSGVRYGVIALGDSTYGDTFALGGIRFDKLLADLGAQRAGEVLIHDINSNTLPEEVAAQWAIEWARNDLVPAAGTDTQQGSQS